MAAVDKQIRGKKRSAWQLFDFFSTLQHTKECRIALRKNPLCQIHPPLSHPPLQPWYGEQKLFFSPFGREGDSTSRRREAATLLEVICQLPVRGVRVELNIPHLALDLENSFRPSTPHFSSRSSSSVQKNRANSLMRIHFWIHTNGSHIYKPVRLKACACSCLWKQALLGGRFKGRGQVNFYLYCATFPISCSLK